MMYVVCSVKDRVANTFSHPFCSPTEQSAVRAFSDLIADRNSGTPSQHPDDFDLYHIAYWDDQDASYKTLSTPAQLALGREVAERQRSASAPRA